MKNKIKLRGYVKLWGKCFIQTKSGEFHLGIICPPETKYVPDENGITFEDMGRRIRCYDCEKGHYWNCRLDSIRKFNEEWWQRINNFKKD